MLVEIIPLALLASLASSAALPDRPDPFGCIDDPKIITEFVSDPHDGKTVIAQGGSCTSNGDQACGLGTSFSHTEGTTISIGATWQEAINKSIFSSLAVSFSKAWSVSDTTGTSTTVSVPKGGWKGTAQVTPQMRTVKGHVQRFYHKPNNCGKPGGAQASWDPFEMEVPAIDPNAPKNSQAVMNFQACALAVPATGYDGKPPVGFPECPGTEGLKGYAPIPAPSGGRCGVHVTQHQKGNPATDSYHFDAQFKDGTGKITATIQNVEIKTGKTATIDGVGGKKLTIKAGAVDHDPVGFNYPGFDFDSNSSVCSIDKRADGYEDMKREMDCTFAC